MYEEPRVETLVINVTDCCNLNCAHCFKGGAGIGEIELSTIEKIIAECSTYGLKSVDFSGGECLLYSKFAELIDMCKKYPNIEFGFISNGLLVSENILDLINEIEKVYFQISIDGATKDSYEKIRGKNTFDAFLKSLEVISRHSIKQKRSRTVINSVNYGEVAAIYELAITHKLLPSFLFTAKVGNAVDNWDWLDLSDVRKIHANNVIEQENRKNGLKVGIIHPGSGCVLTENKERNVFTIGADGSVYFCDYLLDYPLGNVNESTILEILNGDSMKNLYFLGKRMVDEMSTKCSNCSLLVECKYGCPGEYFASNKEYESICHYRKLFFACATNQYI